MAKSHSALPPSAPFLVPSGGSRDCGRPWGARVSERREEGEGRKGAAPPAPRVLREDLLVEKEGSAALKRGSGRHRGGTR